MNHLSLLPLAGALILTASVAWSANEPAALISVVMKSISYDPKSVEVSVGGSIVWTNKAFTNHTATSDDGATFDTGEIKPNDRRAPGGLSCSAASQPSRSASWPSSGQPLPW